MGRIVSILIAGLWPTVLALFALSMIGKPLPPEKYSIFTGDVVIAVLFCAAPPAVIAYFAGLMARGE